MAPGSVALLGAAPVQYKSGAVFHPYRQESNFFWLTGWNEDQAVAVLQKTGPAPADYHFRLFVKPKNAREEQWSGYRNGVEAAEDVFNADQADALAALDLALPAILHPAARLYCDAVPSDALAKGLAHSHVRPPTMPLQPLINKLRLVKSPAEVANLRKAGRISGRAITEAMRRPWTSERELQAFLDYRFILDGCHDSAYIPVVAGGQHANCIHYTANNDRLQQQDMVLVDAGGEYGMYVSDISRTWPLSGSFTDPQRDLYQAVLEVQRQGLSLCRQDAGLSLQDIHALTARGLVDGLNRLGFNLSMSTIDRLFPHHVGHYIGLDVHDCPLESRSQKLRKGHCLTIEPGVYVPDDDGWPRHFRGLGIRIEDSVCVEEDSPLILTVEAVKEVDDIEALR